MKKLKVFLMSLVICLCAGLFFGCSLEGKSAYDIAVENGFVGSETEWLESLKQEGKSAYEIAVENGFEGTESEWLESLQGEVANPGKSAYDIAVENGFVGTEEEWLESLIVEGDSAYEIAVKNGFEGTEIEWLESLHGTDGLDGASGEDGELTAKSLFETAVSFGLYENTAEGYQEFIRDYFLNTADSTIEEVSNKCINSAVSIFIPTDEVGYFSCGSGVFIEVNKEENYAYILTNYHVVLLEEQLSYNNYNYSLASEIYCYSYGYENLSASDTENLYNDGFKAKYIGGSAEYDIAVLKVEGEEFDKIENRDVMAVTFGDSSEIALGEQVIAIGNARGNLLSVVSGVVSKVSEVSTVEIAGETRATIGFRFDAPINKGNSGGGVFNMSGELIGIANAKYMAVGYEGLGNAIYSNLAKAVSENIIESYEAGDGTSVGVNKVVFGIVLDRTTNTESEYDEATGLTSITVKVEVTSINVGSIGEKMNLKVGDKIVGAIVKSNSGETREIDFKYSYDLNEFAVSLRIGDTIQFIVEREIEEVSSGEGTEIEDNLQNEDGSSTQDQASGETSSGDDSQAGGTTTITTRCESKEYTLTADDFALSKDNAL